MLATVFQVPLKSTTVFYVKMKKQQLNDQDFA